jgi:hypothetical protein
MKLKKKEDQHLGPSVLLRRCNKILMGTDTETKYGAETEGKAFQRLPHLRNPSHIQSTNETIVYAKKCMLTGT